MRKKTISMILVMMLVTISLFAGGSQETAEETR